MRNDRIVVYGAFNSPWSYLASRRVELLAAVGLRVDWRAVDAETGRRDRLSDRATWFQSVREEMDQVVATLLPGERLPYTLAGFITRTDAAVTAYGEAYRLGAGPAIRGLLFEAFWLHAIDLEGEQSVGTLVADALQSDIVAGEPSWGRLTNPASLLLSRQWATEWRDLGSPSPPALIVEGSANRTGSDAVGQLGEELLSRGVDIESTRSSLRRRGRP